MKTIDTLKIEFDSRSVNESFARISAAAFLARLDPTLEELNDVKTAVSEAVTNCIVHAYPNTIGKIKLSIQLKENRCAVITVKDHGCGIEDIEQAKTPLFTTGGSERSGMGFSVMECFMNRLHIKSKPQKGTTIIMTKQFQSKEPCSV